ncbi:SPW repeat protein [Streptomyces sp. TRM 70361]|uniref:SPW repeat protein n=1 Tax=Streptomyces sp. TRM 70361 TaxID=3116553 RepID=UPI002E7BAC82|nr:SPW repeat protein [Streptomyces sp. TRM 70361]MEE1941071.1 SPW repeat protein [Streptomyces sp. TRM 70361]
MATPTPRIEEHPDLVGMRARYAQASTTPTAQGLESLTLLAGVFLLASPWIVGFTQFNALTVNNFVTGIALAVIGLALGVAFERAYGLSWAVCALGAWTVLSPWLVSGNVDTTRTILTNVITGGIVFLLGLALLAIGRKGGKGSGERGRG